MTSSAEKVCGEAKAKKKRYFDLEEEVKGV